MCWWACLNTPKLRVDVVFNVSRLNCIQPLLLFVPITVTTLFLIFHTLDVNVGIVFWTWGTQGMTTKIFSICFLEKIFEMMKIFLGGQIIDPSSERTLFSLSNSLLLVSDPWRAFWAGTEPFKVPQPCLALCLRSYRGPRSEVRFAKRKVPFDTSFWYILLCPFTR